MKKFFLFSIIFLALISSSFAYGSYNDYIYSGAGPSIASYKSGNLYFPEYPSYLGSGVYNYRRTGTQFGQSPFYASSSPATYKQYWRPNSHIYRSDSLAEAVYQNPELLRPRYITNWHRETKSFDLQRAPQYYLGSTGNVRYVYNVFN